MTNQTRPHQFTWTNGNRFTFLRNGDTYYRSVIQAIEQAHHWIAMEMYLVKSGTTAGKMIEALCAASKRGVMVHLLFDALGSRGLLDKDIVHLRAAGCELHFFNPPHAFSPNRMTWFHRDHRKLILVDNLIAFVGGAGIADEFSPNLKKDQHWEDLILMIYGPCINQWRDVFNDAWPGTAAPELQAATTADSQRDEKGRVCFSAGLRTTPIQHTLYSRIREASHTVWLVTPYFHPSIKLRHALIAAAKQKIDVRLLVPGRHIDHRSIRSLTVWHYPKLLRAGVKIYEYQTRFIHAKGALVDDWVSIGSCNMDRWTGHWNREANQEIQGEYSKITFRSIFSAWCEHSLHLTEERWTKQSAILRLINYTIASVLLFIETKLYLPPKKRPPL